MKISLVINTYNRMHTLPTTLRSLELLRYPKLEIIVVDGPSTDGTLAYLRANWEGKIKLVTCDVANLSKSRNIGIQNASGQIVCFTDDDGVPEPDWLDHLVRAYENPRVGAAGGWVRNHTGVEYQTKYIVSSRDSTSEVLIENESEIPECEPFAEKFPGLIGVNSSFRRSALLEIGGFDEQYIYFLDETDVLARMVNAGYTVKMVPNAEVHHKYASSHIRTPSGVSKSWLQIVTSAAYYVIKNASPGTNLSVSMATIGSFKAGLKNHTNWYLAEKMIDQGHHSSLIAEIDKGAREGIADAFRFPNRRLLEAHEGSGWKSFPRPMAFHERLRLAFVTALYPPRACGGVAVFMHSLARRLAEFGHEITVITQAAPGNPHTVDFEDGVWVHRLPDTGEEPAFPEAMPDMPHGPGAAAARTLAELDRVNPRRSFQYVIGTIWDVELAGVIASRRYSTAMYLVTSYKLMEESKPEWKRDAGFYEGHVCRMIAAETWALGRADRVFASTSAILADTEEAYGVELDRRRLVNLPFGVSEPSVAVRIEGKEREIVEILFVGRFERRKGIDVLLECIPALLTRHPNARAVCIGDNQIDGGDGETYLEAFTRQYRGADWFSRVEFRGHVDAAALERAYAECDIFVAPSRYESFGLIYLEAMRFGKPCIATSVGGIPEVVLHEQTGLLVEPGEREPLERAIEQLIQDEARRKELGANGLARYNLKFTTERFAHDFVAEIRRALASEDGDAITPGAADLDGRRLIA